MYKVQIKCLTNNVLSDTIWVYKVHGGGDGSKVAKKKKASKAVRTPRKPIQKSGFDYFVEFWGKFKTISRSSSV